MKHHVLTRVLAFALAMLLALTPVLATDTDDIQVRDTAYREGEGVLVALTAPIGDTGGAFRVTGPEGEVDIISVTQGENNIYTLTVGDLSLTDSYTLHFAGEEREIRMPDWFSSGEFESLYTYDGDDLGAVWTTEKTTFRVWAPTASSVRVNLYESGTAGTDDLIGQLDMTADVNGTWVAEKTGDLNGVYYTYLVDGTREACDPYARTTGVNGLRAMVIDLDSTDPEGWENDADPNAGNAITDAVIYELHVRDLSVDESSGIENKGKFLGLIESGTTNSSGIPTGLDHMVDLGITHLHLLPSYDYASVDETRLEDNTFNWGYDPVNYNVPEGSYSTDPYDGFVRVREMKQMVKGLHDSGISVIMDVVYNHVSNAETFCFNQIVPQYFTRITDGIYSNGSICGNDTASEREMVKKYIVDSVKYWADEYHIDGFRFDLAGLIDTETINAVMEEVHATHPNVIFYGEGWTMGTTLTKDGYDMTTQANSTKVPGFAFFNDSIRDAIRGSNSNASKQGFAAGTGGYTSKIKDAFLGTTTWCKSPTQTINYASCHDGYTLFDRLTLSTPDDSFADRVRMNNLAAAIVMTSQGTPFIQAGEELLRSKPTDEGFEHNSYNSSDAVNSIKWDTLEDETYQAVRDYYKGLIAFRKAHGVLRLTTAEDISAQVRQLGGLDFNVLGFQFSDEKENLVVIFNPNRSGTTVELPEGKWQIHINGESAGTEAIGEAEGTVTVDAISTMVLVQPAADTPTDIGEPAATQPQGLNVFGAVCAVIAGGAAGMLLVRRRRRK